MSRSAKGREEELPCLKNARVKKDADGHYYLFIQVRNGNSAMINLTAMNESLDEQIKNEINPARGKSDLTREIFDTWISEQNSSVIEVRNSDNLEDFPEVING